MRWTRHDYYLNARSALPGQRLENPPDPELLPEFVRDLVDLYDPDIMYVADAIEQFRFAGADVQDREVLCMAIAAGHAKAQQARDDFGVYRQTKVERQRQGREEAERRSRSREEVGSVYYARIGNRVKIGCTTDLHARMTAIFPEELMAAEPGAELVEARRHAEFAALRVQGEWFRLESPLTEHIADTAARHPILSGYPTNVRHPLRRWLKAG